MDEILAEAARKRGVITIRRPMGKAGAQHRQRQQQVQELVENGDAQWLNAAHTQARLTRNGWSRAG